mmetsp:Transcript_5813/g.18345  ORF Transcript_5813/g.18345 Transcript_5813/m.18345 type:complete len:348 (-) Transcript_5813:199-1242(-)
MFDELVLFVAFPEARQDVALQNFVAESDQPGGLGGDVLVVTGDHFDRDSAGVDLFDHPLCIFSRRIKHRNNPGEVHHPVAGSCGLLAHGDTQGLVAFRGKLLVDGFYLVANGGDVGTKPGAIAAVVTGLNDFVQETFTDLYVLTRGTVLNMCCVSNSSFDFRVETDELSDIILSNSMAVVVREGFCEGLENRNVDGIVCSVRIGGEGCPLHHFIFRIVGRGPDLVIKNFNFSSGERARFVGAENGHGCYFLHGCEVGDNSLLLGHLPSTESERYLHHDGEGNGDSRDKNREDGREGVQNWLTANIHEYVDGNKEDKGDGHDKFAYVNDGAFKHGLRGFRGLLHEERC